MPVLRLLLLKAKGALDLLKQLCIFIACCCVSAISPVNQADTQWIAVSLCRDDRRQWLSDLMRQVPMLQIYPAINGYDPLETMTAFRKSGLSFSSLGRSAKADHHRYGKLACFLTRYCLLLHQISERIPYMVILEDDIAVGKGFAIFARVCMALFRIAPDVNIVRLGPWGECYITSLKGAERIVASMRSTGIVTASDMQIRKYCGPEVALNRLAPLRGLVAAHSGDINRTEVISAKDTEELTSTLGIP